MFFGSEEMGHLKKENYYALIPMFPYNPAAMIPVMSPMTFPTVWNANVLMPWNASGSVNWPWNEYTKTPKSMYTTAMSNWEQHCFQSSRSRTRDADTEVHHLVFESREVERGNIRKAPVG